MAADPERGRYVVVVVFLCWSMILGVRSIEAERSLGSSTALAGSNRSDRMEDDKPPPLLGRLVNSLSKNGSHSHAWPELELGWRVVLGSTIAFAGSALGSVGGAGGGGIFVPMLTLILGFDLKTSAAISKCMIMGASGATVYYNLRYRHHTLDMPIIDFDLALLFQPMLLLGISIGIAFNVIFAEWMITTILIILFLGTSTKAFLKGIETWRKESVLLKEADWHMASSNKQRGLPRFSNPSPSNKPRNVPRVAPTTAFATPACTFFLTILSGAAIGAGYQSAVAYVNLVCFYIIGFPLGIILGCKTNLHVKGIWIGTLCGSAVQILILIRMTIKTDWEQQVEIAKARLSRWQVPSSQAEESNDQMI